MSAWHGFLAGFGWTRLLPLRDFRASDSPKSPDHVDVTEVIGPGDEDDELPSTSDWRSQDVIDVEQHGTTGMVDHLLRAQAALGVPTEEDADLFRKLDEAIALARNRQVRIERLRGPDHGERG